MQNSSARIKRVTGSSRERSRLSRRHNECSMQAHSLRLESDAILPQSEANRLDHREETLKDAASVESEA
jgi:hypothetical protein